MTTPSLHVSVSARASAVGWAWSVVRADGTRVEGAGSEAQGTAYRGRLQALADALAGAPDVKRVEVHTTDGMIASVVHTYLPAWKRNGWRKESGGRPEDVDVLQRLAPLLDGRELTFAKIGGRRQGIDAEVAKRARVACDAVAPAEPEPAEKEEKAAKSAASGVSEVRGDTEVVGWTDGGCRRNPGPGGWGFVLVHVASGKTLQKRGGTPETTNNRMELSSVIELLRTLTRPTRVEIRADSKYVIDAATKWMKGWKKNNWRRRVRSEDGTEGFEEIKNPDLIRALDAELAKHEVTWTWVRGHTGDPGNELADQLCNHAIDDVVIRKDPSWSERTESPPFTLRKTHG